MKDIVDELYAVIRKYQEERGMSFCEAIGVLQLMSDELSQECRRNDLNRGEQ